MLSLPSRALRNPLVFAAKGLGEQFVHTRVSSAENESRSRVHPLFKTRCHSCNNQIVKEQTKLADPGRARQTSPLETGLFGQLSAFLPIRGLPNRQRLNPSRDELGL
jgi:hypothetical protein